MSTPPSVPMTFEQAWAKKVAEEGYQYGEDALEQVRFGWDICAEYSNVIPAKPVGREKALLRAATQLFMSNRIQPGKLEKLRQAINEYGRPGSVYLAVDSKPDVDSKAGRCTLCEQREATICIGCQAENIALAALNTPADDHVECERDLGEKDLIIASGKQLVDEQAAEIATLNKLLAAFAKRDAEDEDWDDKELPEDDLISKAHPMQTKRFDLYNEAMRLVGAKQSKGALVDLVNWLLFRLAPGPPSIVQVITRDIGPSALCDRLMPSGERCTNWYGHGHRDEDALRPASSPTPRNPQAFACHKHGLTNGEKTCPKCKAGALQRWANAKAAYDVKGSMSLTAVWQEFKDAEEALLALARAE